MRLTGLDITDILAIHRAQLTIDKPILLIGAENGKGKSGLCEIIRHAMTGVSTRVGQKKEFKDLIHDRSGAKAGSAVIEWTGGKASLALPSGAQAFEYPGVTMGESVLIQAALPFVLDPARFAAITPDERREFLYTLTRVDATPSAVLERLIKRNCDVEKSKEAAPLVINGFDFAAKEASAKAREAKGAWKARTGETYGPVKAETWKAVKPEFDAEQIASTAARIDELDIHINTGSEALGELTGRANRARDQATRIEALQTTAARRARVVEKLTLDRAEHAKWQTKVDETRAKATGAAAKKPDACPHCGGLVERGGDKLVAYVPPKVTRDDEAAAKLPEYEQALATMKRSVESGERDLTTVDSAVAALSELEQSKEEGVTQSAIDAARSAIDDLRTERRAAQDELATLNEAKRKADAADEITGTAAGHHADVAQWEAIAIALSPTGIPNDLMSTAVEPVNLMLAEFAEFTQWEVPAIGPDMLIKYGARPYVMRSKSEQFRADVLIAGALAVLSGLRFLCIDAADILQASARQDLIEWLNAYVATGDLESAVVTMTLNEPPAQAANGDLRANWATGLPEHFQSACILDGVVSNVVATELAA